MVRTYKTIFLSLLAGLGLQTLASAQTEEKVYYYNGKPVKAIKSENQTTKNQPQQISPEKFQEEEVPVDQTLTIRPFSFIKSKFVLGFEQATAPKKSISLYGGITAADYSNYYDAYDVLGFDFQGQYRFYVQPNRKGLSGIYAGPYAFYKTIKMDLSPYIISDPNQSPYTNQGFKGNSYGAGVLIGYQLVIKNTAVIDLFTGGGIRISDDNLNDRQYFSNIKEYTESGIYPNISLQVGFSL